MKIALDQMSVVPVCVSQTSKGKGAPIMMVELAQIGGVLVFAVSLLSLRELFLTAHLGDWRKANEERFKDCF